MKIAIQAVRARATSVESIMASLISQGVEPKIYWDEDRNGSLWNFERIMRDSLNNPNGVLVLQDDVAIPPWFMREFEASHLEGKVMSYFMGMSTEQAALYDDGMSYAKTRNVWGQANYYPKEAVAAYVEWSETQPAPAKRGEEAKAPWRKFSGDDSSVCAFLRESKQFAYLTLPNLVNHQLLPSEMGHPTRIGGKLRTTPIFGTKYLRQWDKTAIGKLRK